MILNPGFGGSGGESLPRGIICAWSGAQNAIPSGWVLCDGNNGTPDLRGRFILGASSGHAAGSKGGEETHKLTISEMPSHNHVWKGYMVTSEVGGVTIAPVYGNDIPSGIDGKGQQPAGGDQPHNNMPPYWALCWIMKT